MCKLYIAMYHYVRDLKNSRYPFIKGLDYEKFKRQIAFFQNRFHVVTMEDVIQSACGGGYLPEDALLLTFDDGYIDHYTYVLPVLKEYHMQGSFFIPGRIPDADGLLEVNKIHFILASAREDLLLEELYRRMDYYRGTQFSYPSNAELFFQYGKANRFDTKETIFIKRMLQTVLPQKLREMLASELFQKFVGVEEAVFARELYLSRDQLRMMKQAGMHIGVHGYSHDWLGNMHVSEMKTDILKALDALDGLTGRKDWTISYPYGSYNKEVVRFAASQGACAGFTTKMAAADLSSDNRMELPRLDCNDFPPVSSGYQSENVQQV